MQQSKIPPWCCIVKIAAAIQWIIPLWMYLCQVRHPTPWTACVSLFFGTSIIRCKTTSHLQFCCAILSCKFIVRQSCSMQLCMSHTATLSHKQELANQRWQHSRDKVAQNRALLCSEKQLRNCYRVSWHVTLAILSCEKVAHQSCMVKLQVWHWSKYCQLTAVMIFGLEHSRVVCLSLMLWYCAFAIQLISSSQRCSIRCSRRYHSLRWVSSYCSCVQK